MRRWHDDLHRFADLNDLGGMGDLLGPGHLRDVDQPLDAPLQLDERAVVHQAHDFALDARADRIGIGDGVPRVGRDLLHAEGDPLALGVEFQHHDLDAVRHLDQLRRMAYPAPRHVADVQDAVDAAQVHERAVAGDVLDRAFENDAFFENFQDLLLQAVPLFFQERPARDDDVAARAVEFEDRELVPLPDELVEVARRPDVHVGAGEKRRDAEVDLEAAPDLGDDHAFDAAAVVGGLFDVLPDLHVLRPLARQHDPAALALGGVEVDVDIVADLDLRGALTILKLL